MRALQILQYIRLMDEVPLEFSAYLLVRHEGCWAVFQALDGLLNRGFAQVLSQTPDSEAELVHILPVVINDQSMLVSTNYRMLLLYREKKLKDVMEHMVCVHNFHAT